MISKIHSLDLIEGTITFWIRAGNFKWNNNQHNLLFEASREEGKISITKDAKNILIATYELKGKKKKEVSIKVEDLSSEKDHMIAFTWSHKENKIVLYLDGEKVGENKIN